MVLDTLLMPMDDNYVAYTSRSIDLEFLWALSKHLKHIYACQCFFISCVFHPWKVSLGFIKMGGPCYLWANPYDKMPTLKVVH